MEVHTADSRPQQIVSRLRDRAASYFPALAGGFSIHLRHVMRRAFATLYDVEITNGRERFEVFVKETAQSGAVHCNGSVEFLQNIPERFRPMPDPKGYERAALLAIDRHFSALSDPRFNTVRVLDEWFDGWAFVMERVPHPPLSRVLPRAMRGLIRQRDLGPAFHNAGAWLKEFHGSNSASPTHSPSNPAVCFDADIAALRELLIACGETRGPFHAALGELSETAAKILPCELPMGLAHADFAPRNVLVAPTNAVTVIDTLAERMAVIYEDIAHFLVHLKGHKLQMLGRGLPFRMNTLAALEREFLRGYFNEDEIPWQTIRLFESKAVVVRWAALQLNCRSGQQSRRLKQVAYQKWVRPFFVRMIGQLREEVEGRRVNHPLANRQAELSSFVERLIRHSRSYFDDLDAPTTVIAPDVIRENRFSTIYSATIVSGKTSHGVIAKVPRNSDRDMANARVDDRPRLAPLLTPREEAEREYAALTHIHGHFSSRNAEVLRSVRPLDFCPGDGMVILEAIDAPTLHDLLNRKRNGDGICLTPTFSSAGRWLRSLHELPLTEHCQTRDTTRQDYLANIARYSAYLATHGVNVRFLQLVDNSLAPHCKQCFPERLPLGLCHGDFAPHNLFAFDDHSVAAFDTLGHWQAPIYEDIAHFLFLLKWNTARLRWTEFGSHERAFLAAYFGDNPVPECAILAFLVLIVLDKWASAIQGVRRASGLKKLAKRVLHPQRHRRFRQAVEQLLAGMHDCAERVPPHELIAPSVERSA